MISSYQKNLIQTIIINSNADTWQEAVKEWAIYDCKESKALSKSCICGKEHIKYLFTIRNVQNGNILYPIGSSCIKKFNRTELTETTTIYESLFKLLHALENNNFITLSSEYFSKKLLLFFLKNNAFKPTKFNDFDPAKDYEFLLKMFNKKDKTSITPAQQKKINALILYSILPYLKNMLNSKILD